MCQNASGKVWSGQTRRLLSERREDDKGRHVIYKILGGVVLVLLCSFLSTCPARIFADHRCEESVPTETVVGNLRLDNPLSSQRAIKRISERKARKLRRWRWNAQSRRRRRGPVRQPMRQG